MDVILHLGAHRTATTTFQHYMHDQMTELARQRIEFWGPPRTRCKIFAGLFRKSVAGKGRSIAQRAEGRVRLLSAQAEMRGIEQLVVSEENIIGTCADNIRAGHLYPGAGERSARVAAAFGGKLRRIVLSVRSQDLWWASACALTVSRGHPVPDGAKLDAISQSRRTWRDVITDIACATPDVEIEVLPFERSAGRPDQILNAALKTDVPPDAKQRWLNRSPDTRSLRAGLLEQGADPSALPNPMGRWQPFSPVQATRLAENYADDMHWLAAGAEGLAQLTQTRTPKRADQSPSQGGMRKGPSYDEQLLQGKLARDGRSGAAGSPA